MSGTHSILFVDAYDSFSRNIVALLYSNILNVNVTIIQIDTNIQLEYLVDLATFVHKFEAIVLGPGPGDPRQSKDVGLFNEILELAADSRIPLLGICLGFQSLCLRYGCEVIRMAVPCHGQDKIIKSTKTDIFAGLRLHGMPMRMMCYNSLAVRTSELEIADVPNRAYSPETCSTVSPGTPIVSSNVSSISKSLTLLAWDNDGYAQVIRHETLPLWGLQFHPESCISSHGAEIIKNWWNAANEFITKQDIPRPTVKRRSKAVPSSRNRRRLMSQTRGIERISETMTSGQVSWTMKKYKNLTSRHFSSLSYKAAGRSATVMLESISRGRYCIYAFTDSSTRIAEYMEGKLTVRCGSEVTFAEMCSADEALSHLESLTNASSCKGGCPAVPFWGGWTGYLSYEMGLDLANIDSDGSRRVPDFSFMFVDRSVVLDQRTNAVCIQSIRHDDTTWVSQMVCKLARIDKSKAFESQFEHTGSLPTILADARFALPDRFAYNEAFAACQEHLHAGNSYELCLTTGATVDLDASSADTSYLLYQNLNKHNPVPFAAYMHFPSDGNRSTGITILSTSPEQFLSCTRTGTLDMIPMKGTVQRNDTVTIAEVHEILQSPKETAENLMIADLIRHDLYSVVGCEPYPYFEQSPDPTKPAIYRFPKHSRLSGEENKDDDGDGYRPGKGTRPPISIPALNSIVPFSTVYQLVSHIRAHPPPTIDVNDPHTVISHNHSALHHVLPPGSMTGAPKKRSCEILQQLEQRNRGVYSGIIGYMDVGGGCAWSVAIRTAFSSDAEDYLVDQSVVGGDEGSEDEAVDIQKRKIWHVGAGGAVTVLSGLEGEWQEMMGKMNNVLKGFREVKDELPPWTSGPY